MFQKFQEQVPVPPSPSTTQYWGIVANRNLVSGGFDTAKVIPGKAVLFPADARHLEKRKEGKNRQQWIY